MIGYNSANRREWESAVGTAPPVASSAKDTRMRDKFIPDLTPSQIEKFWSLVEVHHPAACWEWTGALDSHGYGFISVSVDGVAHQFKAHRVAYALLVGQLGDDDGHHLCQFPRCCNPDHVQPLSRFAHSALHNQIISNWNRTHCIHGHPYTPENTAFHVSSTGRTHRRCLTCRRTYGLMHQRKRRATLALSKSPRHCSVCGSTIEGSSYSKVCSQDCRQVIERQHKRAYKERKRAARKAVRP